MKGVILAGGNATRLRPLTWVVNKHLLPIYHKPMIFYPLEVMIKAGIKDILITTNPECVGQFMNLFRTGRELGVRISYEVQSRAGGLSDAVSLAEHFAADEPILVILGDNIFTHNLKPAVEDFLQQERGAKIFAKHMPTECAQYGVIELAEDGRTVRSIEEKPKAPKSPYAQTGIYMYDSEVFSLIKQLKPSGRGELEITDLNNLYREQGTLTCEIMDGWWVDAGTSFDELHRANRLVYELIKQEKNGAENIFSGLMA